MCLWGDTVEHLWDQTMKSAAHGAAEQPARVGPATASTNAIDRSTEADADADPESYYRLARYGLI